MKSKTLFLKISNLIFLLIPLLITNQGIASSTCNLEENSISLEIINKPLKEVLKEIEKQTDYKFEVRDNKALNEIKSIILKNCPLDEGLKRLLKDVNHSIICNDKQKSLTLIFFDKDNKTYAVTTTNTALDNFLKEMEKLDITLENYDQNKSGDLKTVDLGEPPEEMKGIDEAVENYNRLANDKSEGQHPIDLGEPPKEMKGIDEALENYNRAANNKSGNRQSIDLGEPPEEMRGIDEAVENYNRMRAGGSK